MVCSAVLLATTVLTLRQLASPHQSAVFVAQQEKPSIPQNNNQTPLQQSPQPLAITYSKHRVAPSTPKSLSKDEQVKQEDNTSFEFAESEPPATETRMQNDSSETLHPNEQTPVPTADPVAQLYDNQEILLVDSPIAQSSEGKSNRFHFTASIGASALPRIGADDVNTIENTLHSISGTTNSYTSMSPSSTLAANVGVNYAIPLGKRQGLELGIGLSGYSHQTEVTNYNIGTVDGIDGTDNTTIYPAGKPEIHSTFSLYASLPLTFNFRPKGKDIGWNLSLTPSHSIATSNMFGNLTGNKSILNPWRLTMGLGLALPRGFIRRLSLTANLLSLYTSSSLHEIGIEIGF